MHALRALTIAAALAGFVAGAGDGVTPGMNSDSARQLARTGDIAFREARFSAAEKAYRDALQADGRSARAYWGLGRLEMIASHRDAARDRIAKAFQLDPRDPDIVLSYADLVGDKRSKIVLLRNYLVLTKNSGIEREQVEEAAARLAITEKLQGREAGRVASGYQSYRMDLGGYFPDGWNQTGLLIWVRLNGGKPLRMILDSGGDGIFVNGSRARAAGIEHLTADRVSGAGSMASDDKDYLGLASRVTVGRLELADALVHVTDAARFPNADGVIGLNVFERFLIRIDARSRLLELIPLADGAAAGMMPAYRIGNLLLVQTAGSSAGGCFMIDTGASFNAVSAGGLAGGAEVEVIGAQGRVNGVRRAQPMRLDIGGHRLMDEQPLSLDLSELSRHAGVEIAGIIGYPLLSRSVLTVNYRDGLVQFGKPTMQSLTVSERGAAAFSARR